MSLAESVGLRWLRAAAMLPMFLPHAVADAASPESYAWRQVAIGGGGFITGIDVDPLGRTRVARADVYGAYLWRDDLDRWVQLVNAAAMPEIDRVQNGVAEGIFEIAVAPSRPERIYMVAKGYVYRSDDRGVTFSRTSHPKPFPFAVDPNSEFRLGGPFLAVSPYDPDLVLFGTPTGLWRSADAGVGWTQIADVPAGADLRPDPGVQSPGTTVWFDQRGEGQIWAMSPGNGMYVSADAGGKFRPLSASGQPQPRTLTQGVFHRDGAFFAVDQETRSVWRYRDGRWSDLTASVGGRKRGYTAVVADPHSGQLLVFDEGGRTFRSKDGGETWQPLAHRSRPGDRDPPWLRVSNQTYFAMGRAKIDPVVPGRIWAGTGTGVYYADIPNDAEEVLWVSQTRGIEELVANDVVQAPGRAPLFAAWDFGIHRRDNLDTYSTGYGPRERVLIAAQQMDWSAANPDFVVTNASDTRTFCCSEDGDAVLAGYSFDAGRSWQKFGSLPTPPGTDPADPWRMSFGSIAVSAGDTRNIVWLPSFDRAPFYTRDRGETWSRVRLPGEVLPFTGSHAAYNYHRKTLAADRVAPGVFYLAHSGGGANAALAGLWVTQDGGEKWTRAFDGEIAPDSQWSAKLRAVPGQAGHLFFTSGVAGDGDTRLRRSTDGGRTWVALEDVDRVDDIGFGKAAGRYGYPAVYISGQMAGQYGIWRSTDGTGSWSQISSLPIGTLDQVTVVAGDPERFGRVYLGYKGSGWIYGQPEDCPTAPYETALAADCRLVTPASLQQEEHHHDADHRPEKKTESNAPSQPTPRSAFILRLVYHGTCLRRDGDNVSAVSSAIGNSWPSSPRSLNRRRRKLPAMAHAFRR